MAKDPTVGRRVRDRRIELGLTQEELAEAMGYKDKSSIYYIESGRNDIPIQKVYALARALRTNPRLSDGVAAGSRIERTGGA